jgi:NTP pyrophosphatase (non-canonical NTP hydrolase)
MSYDYEVLKQLNEEFGSELFDITRHADKMTEDEAAEVMKKFTERVGKSFGDD